MDVPLVFLNAAMTLDGKIATRTGDVELSSEDDWKIVHNLRNKYQGLMIGGNTARTDDPKLTVKESYIDDKASITHPVRIIVDSKALLKSDARCITYKPEIKTIIGVSKLASQTNISRLKRAGAEIILKGENKVDLVSFLTEIKEKFQIKDIMLEGGGMLIWSMLELKLINRFRFYIAPRISGGDEAVSIVKGKGYDWLKDSPFLKYTTIEKLGNGLVIQGIFQY